MSLFEMIIGLSGLTIIMSAGSIFDSTREFVSSKNKFLGELVSCPMCLGFWVGLFFGFLLMNHPPVIVAGMVSVISWGIFNFVDLMMTISAYYTGLIAAQGEFNSSSEDDKAEREHES
jgi:hypothetical protein